MQRGGPHMRSAPTSGSHWCLPNPTRPITLGPTSPRLAWSTSRLYLHCLPPSLPLSSCYSSFPTVRHTGCTLTSLPSLLPSTALLSPSRFLHLWVQEGVHEDPFDEFGISVNSRFLFRKGRFRRCFNDSLEALVPQTIRAIAAFVWTFQLCYSWNYCCSQP